MSIQLPHCSSYMHMWCEFYLPHEGSKKWYQLMFRLSACTLSSFPHRSIFISPQIVSELKPDWKHHIRSHKTSIFSPYQFRSPCSSSKYKRRKEDHMRDRMRLASLERRAGPVYGTQVPQEILNRNCHWITNFQCANTRTNLNNQLFYGQMSFQLEISSTTIHMKIRTTDISRQFCLYRSRGSINWAKRERISQ